MATYQTRHRDPLLDSKTQAALERRGRELFGLVLVVLAAMTALMVASYSPDDPNFMLASDAPVHNLMGRWGAAIAAPMFMILGRASWMVAVVLAAWGLRFMTHRGEERALGRAVIAPLAVLSISLYAATLTPPQGWVHSFGLGGLLGDTVLSVVLTLLPIPALTSVRIMALILGPLAIWLSAYGLGFTRAEVRQGLRFLGVGTVLLYDLAVKGMGHGAAAGVRAAQTAQDNYRNRADMRQTGWQAAEAGQPRIASVVRSAVAAHRAQGQNHDDAVIEDQPAQWPHPPQTPRAQAASVIRHHHSEKQASAEPPLPGRPIPSRQEPPLTAAPTRAPLVATRAGMPPATAEAVAAPAYPVPHKPGLLSLLGLGRRAMPEPAPAPMTVGEAPADRVQARITDAIRARAAAAQTPAEPQGFRIEPALTAGRGPKALVLPADALLAPEPELVRELVPELVDEPLPDYDDDDLDWAPYQAGPTDDTFGAYEAPEVPGARVIQPTARKSAQPSKQARQEAQPRLPFEPKAPAYEAPPLSLLMNPRDIVRHHLSDEALEENARMLESVLDDYGVKGEIVAIRPGPVVTMYELEPAPGLKASRVIGLSDDIARSMSALSARVSTVPGRSVIGIELPNVNREKVVLREILAARDFGDSNMRLPLALGKDIGGDPVVANLAKMPHLLIAGTTGSGKSVAINTMILSLLYKLTPEECRLIMIDPKMLELSVYDGIPHLLSPVVTDPKKAVVALKWVVGEMEERYRKMSKMGVRNIEGYNGRVRDALSRSEMFSRTIQTGFDDDTGDPIFETEEFAPEVLPYIVVIVDEMADLMMVAGKEIEACIQRLAQMARASGIHLIMATQRPSVDVITGTIKANFPTRISFQVTSKIDSRTILGEQGAEQLLGMGDMLYMAGGARITRVHGPFVSDEEVEEVVTHLKSYGPPEYVGSVVEGHDDDREAELDLVLGLGSGEGDDALYDQAVAIVIKDRKCSTSYIQRKLAIGYNKAARLVEQMEDEGVVSPANHVGKREILVPEGH